MHFDGILFFPVTPFAEDGTVDIGLAREHVASRLPHHPGCVFAACGTGEYHSLTAQEAGAVIGASVTAVSDSGTGIPVLGGAGGPLGHALDAARAAEDAGAAGLLVLPPYLVNAPVDGLVRYVEAIASATDLELVIYHRANARFTPEAVARLAADPQIVGFKDGVGDVALAQEVVLAVEATGRTDFQFFNGLLTAELSQSAYRGIGVPLYSSAAFAMAPEVANAYYRALETGDEGRRKELLDGFFRPLVALRDMVPGYAVSLIKAGVRLGGLEVGGVRPPLVGPRPEHLKELERILAVGHELAAGAETGALREDNTADGVMQANNTADGELAIP